MKRRHLIWLTVTGILVIKLSFGWNNFSVISNNEYSIGLELILSKKFTEKPEGKLLLKSEVDIGAKMIF